MSDENEQVREWDMVRRALTQSASAFSPDSFGSYNGSRDYRAFSWIVRPVLAGAPWECPRCHAINEPHVNRCNCTEVLA